MKNRFNKLHWHDAELQNIHIDRSDPGKKDQVVLTICWPNKKKSEVIFNNCYAFRAHMNFGIIAEETIIFAEYIESSEELNEIRRSWKKIGVDLSDLGQYKIKTNSTNSSLMIYACEVLIKNI